MIILSPNFVLAEIESGGDIITADNPIIGWRNIVTRENVSVSMEDADHPAVNLANPATHLYWKSQFATAQFITIDTNSADEIDYIAIARHNLSSVGVSVAVQGNTGAGWFNIVSETMLADDGPTLFRFAPQVLQSIRLKLFAGLDEYDPPLIAVVYVGRLLVLQRRIYVGHTPLPMGRVTRVINGRSENGNFLGRLVVSESRENRVPLRNITPDWYRQEMEPFVARASEHVPFFFGWRPLSYPREIGYAWVSADVRPSNQRNNGMMQVDLSLEGVA